MSPQDSGIRMCYVHPRRVAIRNCASCGRPICKECGKESGDPAQCKSCKEKYAAKSAESAEESPFAPRRRTPVVIAEVTVFSDGTVQAPEVPVEDREE